MLQRFDQLLQGKHAATMLISPFDVLAEAHGMKVLADASTALGSYQGLVGATRRSWAAQNPQLITAYIKAYQQGVHWLYDPSNKQAALELFVRNVPNSTLQSAAIAYGIMLHPTSGLERTARISEQGMQTVIALREKYGRPAKKLQPASSYYEPTYFQAALR